VPAAIKQAAAGDGLERRHLPRHGRLRVAEGVCRGREGARLRDLAQNPQPTRRKINTHAYYAWYLCIILVFIMHLGS
jgi:hypothetical protein